MTESKICTCPSGDGSLRWPCPKHPAVEQAVAERPVAFLYRGTYIGDQLTLFRLDHYWRPKYSTKEHDYIKGIPLYAAPVSQTQHSVPIAPEFKRALGLVVAALEADGDRPTSKYALSELKKVLAAASDKEII